MPPPKRPSEYAATNAAIQNTPSDPYRPKKPLNPSKLQDYVYEYRRYLQVIFRLYTALKRLNYLARGLA